MDSNGPFAVATLPPLRPATRHDRAPGAEGKRLPGRGYRFDEETM
jgi:hypothetical protein